MPVTKDKVFQIRLEQDLFDRISRVADSYDMSLSALIRSYLRHQVKNFEHKEAMTSEYDVKLASRAAAAVAAGVSPDAPESPLVRKRRLEKAAKDFRAKKKANHDD